MRSPGRTTIPALLLVVIGTVGPSNAAAQDGDWWQELDGAGPGLHVIERDSLYRVSGSSYEDVHREMQRNGPGVDDIGVRLGVHVSSWRWSYEFRTAPGERCRLTSASVLLRSVIVLPEWTNVASAPSEISRGWRPFLAALRSHEAGHRTRAKAQGVFLWQSLLGLEGADCADLEVLVKKVADRVIAEGREAQLAYDRDTGHGLTQGAIWPPRR
jgi:predicted secreted Zn-dependent protease